MTGKTGLTVFTQQLMIKFMATILYTMKFGKMTVNVTLNVRLYSVIYKLDISDNYN